MAGHDGVHLNLAVPAATSARFRKDMSRGCHGGRSHPHGCLAQCDREGEEAIVVGPGGDAVSLLPCGACGRLGPPRRPCANLWCGRADRGWSVVFALGCHGGGLRQSIARYKFGGERWWAEVFARLLADYLGSRPTWFEEYDLIVPMPSYRGVGARRDWDPVGLIFSELATLVGSEWACEPHLLAKVAETAPMSRRSRAQRVELAEGSLRAALVVTDPVRLARSRVLVVDDVLTEGSSLREVAAALCSAGAEEVAGLVLARQAWEGPRRVRTRNR